MSTVENPYVSAMRQRPLLNKKFLNQIKSIGTSTKETTSFKAVLQTHTTDKWCGRDFWLSSNICPLSVSHRIPRLAHGFSHMTMFWPTEYMYKW